jgi:hypothetical protein
MDNHKHAPSHTREEFQEWLDSYELDRLADIDPGSKPSLLDALAECGDVLPADYCDQLEIPKGSTYAQAVSELRRWHTGQKAGESERSARDVYCEYVEKAGEEAGAYAVLHCLDESAVVEILLDRINADELEDYLHDNVIAEGA